MKGEKQRLEELIERYDAKARRNYDNYQATGTTRYMREYENAEELAGFLRRALASADDHQKMVNYRLMLQDFCARAIRCKNDDNHVDMYELVKSLASYGVSSLGLEDKYMRKE